MEEDPEVGEFRPELLSRRGEVMAWLTTLLWFAAWTILSVSGRNIVYFAPILSFLFLLIAASISLGNWVDRRTVLRLKEEGLAFKNGLRDVHLLWDEINEIQVFSSNWGKKVRVLGERAHFDFRTLGELTVRGEVKGRMGFPQGEYILQVILRKTHFKEVEHTGNSFYYSR
jgi:hypothetical protein